MRLQKEKEEKDKKREEEECTFTPRISSASINVNSKGQRDSSIESFQKKEEHFYWNKKTKFAEGQKQMAKQIRELSN